MGRKLAVLLLVVLFAGVVDAGVTVSNVTIRQRWPWNGLADIDYEVASDIPDAYIYVSIKIVVQDQERTIVPRTLSGEGGVWPVKAGKHRMTWNIAADEPGLHSSALLVTISAFASATLVPYLVIDLRGGASAAQYPVHYSATPPDISDDTCRTSQLWLRLIMPGTFQMGEPLERFADNPDAFPYRGRHNVTLTQPFYIGIFEFTRAQLRQVTGYYSSAAMYDNLPAEQLPWELIRGGVLPNVAWPASREVGTDSLVGRLRTRTGLFFDLPTEAQWEYACRAGTTTDFNNGYDLPPGGGWDSEVLDLLGRFYLNYDESAQGDFRFYARVGSYLPNAWGLYDMHGNVREWCLDWEGPFHGDATDPVGPASGSQRVARGGGCGDDVEYCTSAYRGGYLGGVPYGCRVVVLPHLP